MYAFYMLNNQPQNPDKFAQVIWLLAVVLPPVITAVSGLFSRKLKKDEDPQNGN